MRAELGKDPTRAPQSQLDLPPGFRFYPTDEELVVHYLCKKAACEPFAVPIIAEVELYKFDPWDLPAKALFGEREWYFFSPRDRKYPNGSRPNRAAGGGYWKATGTDKPISSLGGKKKVGVKKALVFYKGKAPKGVKTNWIMHEYRLADVGASASLPSAKRKGNLRLDDWVLCRIYKKSSSAASQEKEVSDGLDDMEAEQSESSGLDDVLVALPELDDPVDAVPAAEAKGAGTHTETQFSLLKRKHSSLQSSLERMYYESLSYSSQEDGWKDGMEELHCRAGLEIISADNGRNTKECRSEYAPDARSMAAIDNAATPESNLCSRQSSPLEQSQSMSAQQAEEEMTMESTLNALGRLPLTQLLSSQSLAMANNSLFGLDLGLPSPCTMFTQGTSFGNSMDPDNFFFQSPHLSIGDPCKINF